MVECLEMDSSYSSLQEAFEADRNGQDALRVQAAYEAELQAGNRDLVLLRRYFGLLSIIGDREIQERFFALTEGIPWDRTAVRDLFLPVALDAFEKADVYWALQVLEHVPEIHRDQQWHVLLQATHALRAAAYEDDGFRPMREWRPRWWESGPESLPPENNGSPLRSWLAVTASEVDPGIGVVFLSGWEFDAYNTPQERYGIEATQVDRPGAEELMRAAGSDGRLDPRWYGELGFYADDSHLLRLQPFSPWPELGQLRQEEWDRLRYVRNM